MPFEVSNTIDANPTTIESGSKPTEQYQIAVRSALRCQLVLGI